MIYFNFYYIFPCKFREPVVRFLKAVELFLTLQNKKGGCGVLERVARKPDSGFSGWGRRNGKNRQAGAGVPVFP